MNRVLDPVQGGVGIGRGHDLGDCQHRDLRQVFPVGARQTEPGVKQPALDALLVGADVASDGGVAGAAALLQRGGVLGQGQGVSSSGSIPNVCCITAMAFALTSLGGVLPGEVALVGLGNRVCWRNASGRYWRRRRLARGTPTYAHGRVATTLPETFRRCQCAACRSSSPGKRPM